MKNKVPKAKKGAWFVRVRGSYLPRTWQAWVCYIPFVSFLVWAQWVLMGSSLETAVAALIYFACLVCSGATMTWIAVQKS
jgi:hypothetical protein